MQAYSWNEQENIQTVLIMAERKKVGGRKAGTPNKITKIGKEFITQYLEDNREEFHRRMAALDDDKYITAYINMMKFVVPQMSAVKVEDANTDENGYKKILVDLRNGAAFKPKPKEGE